MNSRRPSRPKLVSGREATRILMEANCCEAIQARHVLACGLAGAGFSYGNAVIYEHDSVVDLSKRPKLSLDDMWDALPFEAVVVARQHARSLTTPRNDPTRDWYGVDLFAPDAEQRSASSRWWELGAERQAVVQRLTRDGPIPLLVSVGGCIVRGYSIAGIDYQLSAENGRSETAFELAEGRPDWAEKVENKWMRTPRGSALLVLIRGKSR